MTLIRLCILALAAILVTACTTSTRPRPQSPLPTTSSYSRTTAALEKLALPRSPVAVAVYDFADLTGAYKPNPNFADYSKAVTQGASTIVVDALSKAGRGRWFQIVERDDLDSLTKERELIQNTYKAMNQDPSALVEPLVFAEYIVQGGIISFDDSVEVGGFGAKWLGLAANTENRKSRVVVVLRLTRVKTGEVVTSVTSTRMIYSTWLAAGFTKYVTVDELFAISGGITRSDPIHVAVQEAIEAAVLRMIENGEKVGAWPQSRGPAPMRIVEREPQQTGTVVSRVLPGATDADVLADELRR